jgi:PAS domain S-box-containing protein
MEEIMLRKLVDIEKLNHADMESERYRSLINILDGYEEYLLNTEGFILSSNLEAVNVTGYEEWEIIGEHFSKFYTVEDQLLSVPQNDLEKAAQRGSINTAGLRIKKRNSSFWAKIKIRALMDQNTVVGFKMTMQDATHKAVSNHRVKKLKDEYLNLFNNSFVGIFKFSMQDFHILMINEKASMIIGAKGEKLKFDTFFEDDDFKNFLREIKTKRKVEDVELKLANKDKWLMVSCRYFRNGDFAEGIMIDVTEYKKRDLELGRLNNELDQFIYHASHELRAPLATMLGIVNLMEYDKKNTPEMNYCTILKEKIKGLDNLLKSIVAISLNNKDNINSEKIDWNVMIPSVVNELGIQSKVAITFTVNQTHEFFGDVSRIRIILINLISNAFKYANPTVNRSWLNIQVSSDQESSKIFVEDNGVGIDPEYLKGIFKMFYKATTQPKGQGLGLYTVKVMLDKLNGKITVTSNLGEGTSVKLVLPNTLPNDFSHPLIGI